MRFAGWIVLAGALALGFGCGDDAPPQRPPESPETRALMRRIYQGLRVALPEAVGDEPFADPARRGEIAAALDLLAENAAMLESHGRDDAVTRHLARSIARDAQEVRDSFEGGRYERSGFLLQQITEHCINCHARLPDTVERPLARGFVDETSLAQLSPEQRASLQIATRRFDDALDTLEGILASPDPPALMLGPLIDYLVVSIRVRGDYDRPLPVLRRFAQRDDLWEKLRNDVEFWVASLPALRARASGPPRLATARAILAEANDGSTQLPGDIHFLVHDVVASGILERYLESRDERDADTAEAYFDLGLIEARIGRNYWVSSAPFLLESAVRAAPHAPFAARAYEVLEEELVLSYQGVEDELPEEDRARLAELRALIDAP